MFQSWLKGWCLSEYTPIWWLIHYILSLSLHIIKIIARKRLLLESPTIFSWKWTLKKPPCWPYSILALVSLRLIVTSSLLIWMRSLGYADWPWNGSGRIWRKRGQWVSIDGSLSERFSLMTHRFISVSNLLVTHPRKMQSVQWNVALRRSGAGWSMTDSLMVTRLSLLSLELTSSLTNCRIWILK